MKIVSLSLFEQAVVYNWCNWCVLLVILTGQWPLVIIGYGTFGFLKTFFTSVEQRLPSFIQLMIYNVPPDGCLGWVELVDWLLVGTKIVRSTISWAEHGWGADMFCCGPSNDLAGEKHHDSDGNCCVDCEWWYWPGIALYSNERPYKPSTWSWPIFRKPRILHFEDLAEVLMVMIVNTRYWNMETFFTGQNIYKDIRMIRKVRWTLNISEGFPRDSKNDDIPCIVVYSISSPIDTRGSILTMTF